MTAHARRNVSRDVDRVEGEPWAACSYVHRGTPPSPVPHHHAPGLAWTSLAENPKVVDFFDVLSLSADRGGNVYVSTMEATYYPITATQWCAHSGGVITCWGV